MEKGRNYERGPDDIVGNLWKSVIEDPLETATRGSKRESALDRKNRLEDGRRHPKMTYSLSLNLK